ncbi:MAG: hypothetical protein A2Z27_03720 [candidate division Zixibacteria bacterium RBG_16_50_21]|nr:MAG: hypothetical protein A2Z27_03720 [candidate division Zixibacteria bacterium RBG_16_50_21]
MRFKTLALVTGLILVLALSAFACDKAKEAKAEAAATTQTTSFAVNGMHCGNCASHVKQALAKVEGVQNVIVSFADSRALIEFDPVKVSEDQLYSTAQTTGFTVVREIKEEKTSKLSSEKMCDPSKASTCPHPCVEGQLTGADGKACCAKKEKKGDT